MFGSCDHQSHDLDLLLLLSLLQLSSLSDSDDALLELFVSLPQLKQMDQDKEELVTNIVEMASEFLLLEGRRRRRRRSPVVTLRLFEPCREKPSDGAAAGSQKTRDALQGDIFSSGAPWRLPRLHFGFMLSPCVCVCVTV